MSNLFVFELCVVYETGMFVPICHRLFVALEVKRIIWSCLYILGSEVASVTVMIPALGRLEP